MKTKNTSDFAIAACLTDLSGNAPTEIQLTLAGTFKARDGRPIGIDGWVMNAQIATLLIEQASAQQDKFIKAKTLIDTQPTEMAAVSSIFDLLKNKDNQIAALSTQTPDLTKFVPVTVMTALQTDLATIQAERMEEKTLKLVEVALSDGRLLPAQKEWAIEAGKKDFAWLSNRIEGIPKNPAFSGMQTDAQVNLKNLEAVKDEVDNAICGFRPSWASKPCKLIESRRDYYDDMVLYWSFAFQAEFIFKGEN